MKTILTAVIRYFVRPAAIVALGLGFSNRMSAQGDALSPEQKEVWKNVETYWALDAAGDTQGFLAYFHADYRGWNYNNALPGSKERGTKFITHSHKTSKTLVYDIEPVTIRVHGDVAFVHYFWTRVGKDSDGKEKRQTGRWTDILKKQGGKWVMIADHGGEMPPKS